MTLSSKATHKFQHKLIKSIVLSILIPSFIIMVSAWYFFGDMYMSPYSSKVKKNKHYCEGAIEETCDKSICSWEPTAKRPDSDNLGMCVALH